MPEDGYTTLAALAEGTDDLEMLKCLRLGIARHEFVKLERHGVPLRLSVCRVDVGRERVVDGKSADVARQSHCRHSLAQRVPSSSVGSARVRLRHALSPRSLVRFRATKKPPSRMALSRYSTDYTISQGKRRFAADFAPCPAFP